MKKFNEFQKAIEQFGERLNEIAKQYKDLKKEIAKTNERTNHIERSLLKKPSTDTKSTVDERKLLFITHSKCNLCTWSVIDENGTEFAIITLFPESMSIYNSGGKDTIFSCDTTGLYEDTEKNSIMAKAEIERYYNNQVKVIGNL